MEDTSPWRIGGLAIISIVGIAIVLALCVAGVAGCKAFSRAQKRADANNNYKVAKTTTKTRIFTAKQEALRVAARDGVVQALADQKVIEAEGIRKAQDKISATLTPLYVQHEAIAAQRAGGDSKVYIPVGPQGVPLVANINDKSLGGTDK